MNLRRKVIKSRRWEEGLPSAGGGGGGGQGTARHGMAGCVGAAGMEAEGASCCPPERAGGEAGQGAAGAPAGDMQLKKGFPATLPVHIRKASSPKFLSMIHHFVLPPGNSRGGDVRWEEGGGAWKTNCSYTSGLWVPQRWKKVLFNCELVTGFLTLALQFQKTQHPLVTPCHAALGRGQPGGEQHKPRQQPGRCPRHGGGSRDDARRGFLMLAEGSMQLFNGSV